MNDSDNTRASDQLRRQLLFRDDEEFPERSFLLGFLHYAGLGVSQDYLAALSHFTRAAEGNLPWAEYAVGYMYETGKGVQKDLGSAIAWYRRAGRRGHASALCALGLILKFGPDEIRDQREAFDLFMQAAKAGSCMAALQIADSLEHGVGIGRDEHSAKEWYFRAVDISDESSAAAHAAMASLYREGRLGVPIDMTKAEEWAKSSRSLLRDLLQKPGTDHG